MMDAYKKVHMDENFIRVNYLPGLQKIYILKYVICGRVLKILLQNSSTFNFSNEYKLFFMYFPGCNSFVISIACFKGILCIGRRHECNNVRIVSINNSYDMVMKSNLCYLLLFVVLLF